MVLPTFCLNRFQKYWVRNIYFIRESDTRFWDYNLRWSPSSYFRSIKEIKLNLSYICVIITAIYNPISASVVSSAVDNLIHLSGNTNLAFWHQTECQVWCSECAVRSKCFGVGSDNRIIFIVKECELYLLYLSLILVT